MRLIQWLRQRCTSPIIETKADEALTQLHEVNREVKAFRDRRTGNPIADMVTGNYRPQRRKEAR